jgi:hypothetical protein
VNTTAHLARPVTAAAADGILSGMTTPSHDPGADTKALFEAAGINVTTEGKQRARARREAAQARWTPERWAALSAQLGLPSRAA